MHIRVRPENKGETKAKNAVTLRRKKLLQKLALKSHIAELKGGINCPRRVLAPNPRRHYRNPRVIENMYGITRKNLESLEQGPQRICG